MVHFQYTFEDQKYKTPLEARLEGFFFFILSIVY